MDTSEFFKQAEQISDDPYSRIPDHVIPVIKDENNLINVHCHIFNDTIVPKRIFNIKMPYSRRFVGNLATLLHKIIGRSNEDKLSNLAYFISLFKSPTEKIADKLVSYFDKNSIFCPLMMDMLQGRQRIVRDDEWEKYINLQFQDLNKLFKQNPKKYNFLPFIPIDPLNEKVYDIFLKAFNGEYGFKPMGIKIYPSLGYLPSHSVLMNIYKVCQEKNIPITAHCSSGKTRGFRKHVKNIVGWKVNKQGIWTQEPESKWFFSGKSYANYFNNPKNWEKVLEAYPKLKLNFGHFGGEYQWNKLLKGKNNTWVSRIMGYFARYENVYADISFTNAYPNLFPLIKDRLLSSSLVFERTLYGLDYYMVVVRGHYRSLKIDFDVAMGEKIIAKIGKENPRKFLF
ncbi:MAG: amidohydrolase family protein [Mariniphaga sp.]|nr:amidohydrolase family protein [Mariniphaga sp.]